MSTMIHITKKCKISKKELKLGIPVEMEHTKSRKVARRIASQHLCEFPNYYSKGLIPMERHLKHEMKETKQEEMMEHRRIPIFKDEQTKVRMLRANFGGAF